MSLSKYKRRKKSSRNVTRSSAAAAPDEPNWTVKFNDLPDDHIMLIFEYFPLQDILTKFRPVCQKWNVVVQAICESKRSLKLFQQDWRLMYYCQDVTNWYPKQYNLLVPRQIGHDDDLTISTKYTESHSAILLNLFPNIERLVIDLEHILPYVPQLLTGWQGLTSLTFFGNIPRGKAIVHGQIYRAISTMTGLRRLDFLCRYLYKIKQNIRIMKPVLANLEHFTVYMHNHADAMGIFLEALTEKCTSLRIEELNSVSCIEKHLKAEIYSSVTHFSITNTDFSVEFLTFISQRLVNLVDLNLEFPVWTFPMLNTNVTFLELLGGVCKMPKLSTLRLVLPSVLLRGLVECEMPYTSGTLKSLSIQVIRQPETLPLPHRSIYRTLSTIFTHLEHLSIVTALNEKTADDLETEKRTAVAIAAEYGSLFPRMRSFNTVQSLAHYGRHRQRHLHFNEEIRQVRARQAQNGRRR